MVSSEATFRHKSIDVKHLGISKKIYYGFTINVSTKKFIPKALPFAGSVYGMLSNEQQRVVLGTAVLLAKWQGLAVNYVYENTELGNAHVHGYFYANDMGAKQFQDKIHSLLGMPRLSKSIVCRITSTYYDSSFWDKYMHKSDDWIPEYNMCIR
ncbi:MAG: putative replicase [Cressdnaviricota sp.]|nr:MAG: putative replicase [Cressdnaviricota sp.]